MDDLARDSSPAHDSTSEIAETAFVAVYTFELVVKMSVHGLYLFRGRDAMWNVFDLVLVVLGLLDTAISWSASANSFRTARILKIARLLRVVRFFRFLRELGFMI